jgi:hypothetical protein
LMAVWRAFRQSIPPRSTRSTRRARREMCAPRRHGVTQRKTVSTTPVEPRTKLLAPLTQRPVPRSLWRRPRAALYAAIRKTLWGLSPRRQGAKRNKPFPGELCGLAKVLGRGIGRAVHAMRNANRGRVVTLEQQWDTSQPVYAMSCLALSISFLRCSSRCH